MAKSTQAQTNQLTIRYVTKTCHLWATKDGWKAAYIETTCVPMICAVAVLAPSEEVPLSCKPAADAIIAASRGRGPIVDATGRRHGGSEFGDRSGHKPVEEGYDKRFVQHARRSAIVDHDSDAATESDLDVAGCDGETAYGEEAEVAIELLAIELLFVAGRIDGIVVKVASQNFGVFSLYGRLIV